MMSRIAVVLYGALIFLAGNPASAVLVAHWPLDDAVGSGSVAENVNAYDGTPDSGVTQGVVDGSLGTTVVELDGGAAASIDLSDHVAVFSSMTSGTVTGWFLNNVASADALFTLSDNTVGSTEGRVMSEGNRIFYAIRDEGGNPVGEGQKILSQEGIADANWHHFAVTIDGDNEVSKLYVDGLLVGQNYAPMWGNITNAATALNNMAIGSNSDSGGVQWGLDGRMSNFAIYDNVLSYGQVRDVMQNGVSESPDDLGPVIRPNGTIAQYKFNEQAPGSPANANDTIIDETGNHDGTVMSPLSYVAGLDGSALHFADDDYADHRIEIAKDEDLYVLPGEGFTVEAIFRTDAPGILTLVSMNGNAGETWMRLQDGEVRWFLNDSGGVGSVDVQSDDAEGEVANTGEWTHVAGVYEPAAEEIRLYINGVLVDMDTAPAQFAAPLNGDTNPLVIGDFADSNTRRFIGDIDEVRITRGALMPGEFLRVVPEPSSALLAVFALAAAGVVTKRGRKSEVEY